MIESGCISMDLEKWILERLRWTETTVNWSLQLDASLISRRGVTAGHS